MSDGRDIRAVMASAVMDAILDVNRADDGSATVDSMLAEHALAMVVALLMEADPGIRTLQDMDEAAEHFANVVRLQLRAFREEHERTGRRGWDAMPGSIQ